MRSDVSMREYSSCFAACALVVGSRILMLEEVDLYDIIGTGPGVEEWITVLRKALKFMESSQVDRISMAKISFKKTIEMLNEKFNVSLPESKTGHPSS